MIVTEEIVWLAHANSLRTNGLFDPENIFGKNLVVNFETGLAVLKICCLVVYPRVLRELVLVNEGINILYRAMLAPCTIVGVVPSTVICRSCRRCSLCPVETKDRLGRLRNKCESNFTYPRVTFRNQGGSR